MEWSREGVERVPLLCAPFERKDFVGLDMESRNNRQGLLLYISVAEPDPELNCCRSRIYKLGITEPIPAPAPYPLFLFYQRFDHLINLSFFMIYYLTAYFFHLVSFLVI